MLDKKDYTKTFELANRLIKKFGRPIQLQILGNFPPIDPLKPWLGGVDPEFSITTRVITNYAISVTPSGFSNLGFKSVQDDFLRKVTNIYIVEPGDSDPAGIESYQRIIDAPLEYKIDYVEKLQPGDIPLLYYIGVSR